MCDYYSKQVEWTIDFEESQYWCGFVSTHDVATVKSVTSETHESSRWVACQIELAYYRCILCLEV